MSEKNVERNSQKNSTNEFGSNSQKMNSANQNQKTSSKKDGTQATNKKN